MTKPFSEQLDQFVERGAVVCICDARWSGLDDTMYRAAGCPRCTCVASLKPIVLKLYDEIAAFTKTHEGIWLGEENSDEPDRIVVDLIKWRNLCETLVKVSQMLEGGSK